MNFHASEAQEQQDTKLDPFVVSHDQHGLGPHQRRHWLLCLAVTWLFAAAYTFFFLDRGWIPHDEGALAHSAERVLGGELPHRDYSEIYTGGLSYYNALAFKIWGVSLRSIRYGFFFLFLLWVPALFYVASRLASVRSALLLSVIAVVWSVPNYPAAMPSWFNLFFATFGLAALFRFTETRERSWLAAAGLAAGLSVLAKTTGVFFVGAGLLFLVWRGGQHGRDSSGRILLVPAILASLVVASAAVALVMIGVSRRLWPDFAQFTLPGLAVVFAAAGSVGTLSRNPRWRETSGDCLVFGLTAALPVVLLVLVYASADALPSLLQGLVALPLRRYDFAAMPAPPPYWLIPALLTVLLVLNTSHLPRWVQAFQSAAGGTLFTLGLLPATAMMFHPLIWGSVGQATPLVVPLLVISATKSGSATSDHTREKWMALASVTAFCSLVAYPFAAPIYFAYAIPFVWLCLGVVGSDLRWLSPAAARSLGIFYLVYGMFYVSPMPIEGLKGGFGRPALSSLNLPRGGLRIGSRDAATHEEAVALLREHAFSGASYAGPDAAQLYFLAELRNPTPAIFDFLVSDSAFYQHLFQSLDSLAVTAVALNRGFTHSPRLDSYIEARFLHEFPSSRQVGRYEIRWKP